MHSIISYEGNANQNDDEKNNNKKIKKWQWDEDFTTRMAMMKIRDVNRYWLGQGETGPLIHFWDCKITHHFGK